MATTASDSHRNRVDPRAKAKAEARDRGTRRRAVGPVQREQESASAELELARAIQEYKLSSGRMFPTWSEVLEVLAALGYRKEGSGHSPAA